MWCTLLHLQGVTVHSVAYGAKLFHMSTENYANARKPVDFLGVYSRSDDLAPTCLQTKDSLHCCAWRSHLLLECAIGGDVVVAADIVVIVTNPLTHPLQAMNTIAREKRTVTSVIAFPPRPRMQQTQPRGPLPSNATFQTPPLALWAGNIVPETREER